jgi:hypothetical protein
MYTKLTAHPWLCHLIRVSNALYLEALAFSHNEHDPHRLL